MNEIDNWKMNFFYILFSPLSIIDSIFNRESIIYIYYLLCVKFIEFWTFITIKLQISMVRIQ